jgi:integrase
VYTVSKRLKHLAEHADLDNPEHVKAFIASKPVANSYKHELAKAYHYYIVCQGLTWIRPKYRFETRVPRIPTGEQLSKIIAGAGPKYQLIFRLLAETGAMPVELERPNIRRDVNLEKGTITIQGCKGHAGRILTLKPSLTAALRNYLAKYNKFPRAEVIGRTWRKYWNRHADPSLRSIRLYDLRHYFGTMTYHKTKDILFVKQQMGHKKIETTMIYTQLINFSEDE